MSEVAVIVVVSSGHNGRGELPSDDERRVEIAAQLALALGQTALGGVQKDAEEGATKQPIVVASGGHSFRQEATGKPPAADEPSEAALMAQRLQRVFSDADVDIPVLVEPVSDTTAGNLLESYKVVAWYLSAQKDSGDNGIGQMSVVAGKHQAPRIKTVLPLVFPGISCEVVENDEDIGIGGHIREYLTNQATHVLMHNVKPGDLQAVARRQEIINGIYSAAYGIARRVAVPFRWVRDKLVPQPDANAT